MFRLKHKIFAHLSFLTECWLTVEHLTEDCQLSKTNTLILERSDSQKINERQPVSPKKVVKEPWLFPPSTAFAIYRRLWFLISFPVTASKEFRGGEKPALKIHFTSHQVIPQYRFFCCFWRVCCVVCWVSSVQPPWHLIHGLPSPCCVKGFFTFGAHHKPLRPRATQCIFSPSRFDLNTLSIKCSYFSEKLQTHLFCAHHHPRPLGFVLFFFVFADFGQCWWRPWEEVGFFPFKIDKVVSVLGIEQFCWWFSLQYLYSINDFFGAMEFGSLISLISVFEQVSSL